MTAEKNKNLKKVLWSLFAIVVAAFLISFILVINALPSMREISSQFSKDKKSDSLDNIEQEITKKETSNEGPEKQPEESNVQKTDSIDTTNEEDQKKEKSRKAKEAIESMISEDPKDIRVCDNLGQSKIFGNQEKINYENIFFESDRSDSIAEAFRLPIRNIFQDENMRSLLEEIFQYENETSQLNRQEKEGFLQKAGFYTKLAWTVGQLYKNKAQFEKMADRSGHLAVLARMAVLKPELANDAQVKDFCRQLETSIGDKQEVNLTEERREVLKMIQYAGLTPEQLKFDPNKFTEFKMKSSKDGVNFSLSDDKSRSDEAARKQ